MSPVRGRPPSLKKISRIFLSRGARDKMLRHCRGAAAADGRAFGLLAGRVVKGGMFLARAYPLRRNMRDKEPWRSKIDDVMRRLAVPSKTPLEKRGWAADPVELEAAEKAAGKRREKLLAAYHMHKVPWPGDPFRDTPTAVDSELAAGCGLWSVIVSMVDPSTPRIRAFFECDKRMEAPVRTGK